MASDPLVSPDVDCTDLDGFMLNVERLMASELVALSSHEVIGAALLLWCRAWKQRPCASLPNDDKVISAFARMPLARFKKQRAEILRGFVLCSDGRLYHSTLAREAMKAYERKSAFQRKREADAERLRKWRTATRDETPPETQGETRFVAEGQGQGQGQVIEKQKALAPKAPATPRDRGSRLPTDWRLSRAWAEAGQKARIDAGLEPLTDQQLRAEGEKFRDHWLSKTGKDATKLDWLATWRNWCRNARIAGSGRPLNGSHSVPDGDPPPSSVPFDQVLG